MNLPNIKQGIKNKSAGAQSAEKTKSEKHSIRGFFKSLLLSEYFVLYLSIAYFLVLAPFVPNLASWENIGNIFSNMWPLLAIAIGQTVVLIIAGIDLSQTSILAFTSVVGALFMTSQLDPTLFTKCPLWGWFLTPAGSPFGGSVWSLPVGIIAMLLTGSFIGWMNGMAVARFKMPPFMVTLVTQMFFSAFAIYLTKSENIIHLPQSYLDLGSGGMGFLSYAFLIAGFLAIAAHILLSRTVVGRWFYATGANVKASLVSGIPTRKVVVLAYVFSGFCAAVSSILYSARLEMGRPTMGQNILMDIVGATVIGGTSLFGGKGKIVWTVFGVFFFVLLSNTLNMLNLSYFTINIVKGSVILLAALFDVTRTRILAKEYRN